MLKRCCATLLLLAFLLPYARAEEPLQFSEPIENICRVLGENRYVNDSTAFITELFPKMVEAFNSAIDALGTDHPPIYLYLVESSRSHAIARTFDENSPGYNYLLENLHVNAFDHLKYTTYEQFCDYFYATDHHWNYKGSYQGYVDIVRLLLGEDEEILIPVEEVVTDAVFNGSYSKHYGEAISDEPFAFYRFDPFPNYTCYTSSANLDKDKRTNYNSASKYLKGSFSRDPNANHYGLFYGGDAGFLIFKGEGPKERVLLMLGNSLSNPIKTMLTVHYGTIVYVDLRYYEKKHGQPFSLSKMIKQYGVTQVLLLGDINLFNFGDFPLP